MCEFKRRFYKPVLLILHGFEKRHIRTKNTCDIGELLGTPVTVDVSLSSANRAAHDDSGVCSGVMNGHRNAGNDGKVVPAETKYLLAVTQNEFAVLEVAKQTKRHSLSQFGALPAFY